MGLVALQSTDFPGGVWVHCSEPNLFSFQFTWTEFPHPGLVGKIRTRRIHPGSFQVHSSTRATSMTSPNWPTMPRNETTTQSQILFRLLFFFFFFFSLLKFNRFSRFKLLCKAEIHALHLMSITHAQGKREIPWHAPKNCEVTIKKIIRDYSSP